MTTRKLAAAVATAALTLGLVTACGGETEAEDATTSASTSTTSTTSRTSTTSATSTSAAPTTSEAEPEPAVDDAPDSAPDVDVDTDADADADRPRAEAPAPAPAYTPDPEPEYTPPPTRRIRSRNTLRRLHRPRSPITRPLPFPTAPAQSPDEPSHPAPSARGRRPG